MTAAVGLVLLSSSFAELVKTKAIPDTTIKMGVTEVTVEQYSTMMGENPSYIYWEDPMVNRPVDSVSWYNAIGFCNLLSIKEGLEPCYSQNGEKDPKKWTAFEKNKLNQTYYKKIKFDKKANGYRLPTVKEWKTACKGEGKFKYPGSDNLDEVAWYRETARIEKNGNKYYGFQTHTVATKKPNEYGMYDMAGNVAEWVNDWPIFPNIHWSISRIIMGMIQGYYSSYNAMGGWYDRPKGEMSINKITKPMVFHSGSPNLPLIGFRICVTNPDAAKAEESKK